MQVKYFWMIELGTVDKPLYLSHFKAGLAFTKDIHQACKFAEEKYAKIHWVNMKAMHPELARLLDSALIVERSFDWSRELPV